MNKLVSFFGRQWKQFNISSTLETCHRVNCPCVEELSRTLYCPVWDSNPGLRFQRPVCLPTTLTEQILDTGLEPVAFGSGCMLRGSDMLTVGQRVVLSDKTFKVKDVGLYYTTLTPAETPAATTYVPNTVFQSGTFSVI